MVAVAAAAVRTREAVCILGDSAVEVKKEGNEGVGLTSGGGARVNIIV